MVPLGAVALIISVVVAVYFSAPNEEEPADPYGSQFWYFQKDHDPSAKVLALSRTPVARVYDTQTAHPTARSTSGRSPHFIGDDSSSSYDGGGDCGGSSDCGGARRRAGGGD